MVEASPLWLNALYITLAVAFVFLNAFFVAAEFAIVKVRSTQLSAAEGGGDARAAHAKQVVGRLDAYLSACQLGITLASLALGWIGEPAFARLIEPLLFRVGVTNPAVLHTVAFSVAFGTITFLHIVLGELVPKSLAIQRPVPTTLRLARPLHWFYLLFRPAIWGLNGLANRILRVAGLPPATGSEAAHSEEELRLILAEAGGTRVLTKQRAEMILNIFDLRKLQARNVMTPRPRIVALDVQKSWEENWAVVEDAGYSRFPLVDGNLDNVLGMVHFRDLSALHRAARPVRDLATIRREVLFVPEGKPVEPLLADLIRQGRHMAIVLDEFGGTAGLVTMEDIFEELFGEIRDEFDVAKSEQPYRAIGDRHYLIEAQMPLHEAADLLGMPLDRENVTTIGGYVVAEAGRLPGKGERIAVGPWEGIVREADRRRVKLLELWLPPEERGEADVTGAGVERSVRARHREPGDEGGAGTH